MDAKERIDKAIKKISQNRTIKKLVMAGAISSLSFGTLQAQTDDAFQDRDSGAKTENAVSENAARQYKRTVRVNSLDEIRFANRPAAEYNSLIDAVIYTQYQMDDANKFERDQIQRINADNYSVNTEAHELLHRKLASISQKTYNGDCIVTVSDRIRSKIMEEICALKAEEGLPSIADAIQRFKELKRDEYYSSHYGETAGERINSNLIAKIAEDRTPEKINQGFERSNAYQSVWINDREYTAWLYKSLDKKYQTWALHGADDRCVTDAAVLAQSSLTVGRLCTADGKEVKTADGKPVTAAYAGEAQNQYGGWDGYSFFKVDNFENRTQGYDFGKAKQNFAGICAEYAAAVGLNPTEAQTLRQYVSEMQHLNAYDLSDNEIGQIRENYKDISLSELIQRQKKSYEQIVSQNREEFVNTELPHLEEVSSPSARISQNDARSLKIDAFQIASSVEKKGGK